MSGWLASLYVRVTRYLDIPWEVVYMAIWLLFISDLYLALLLHNVSLWQPALDPRYCECVTDSQL